MSFLESLAFLSFLSVFTLQPSAHRRAQRCWGREGTKNKPRGEREERGKLTDMSEEGGREESRVVICCRSAASTARSKALCDDQAGCYSRPLVQHIYNPASSARSLVEVELNLNPCAPSQYTGADHNLKTIKSPVPKL